MALLGELGIANKLRWRTTSMGIFTGGRLYDWGNPIALLTFPEISLLSRLRYALFAFVSVRKNRWDAIETESARSWITRWCGAEVYERLWSPLLELKFFRHAEDISAAWIWTRIRRIGRSRKSLMQEELGYLEGGSQVLVDALCSAIRMLGGELRTACPVLTILTQGGRVTGVATPHGAVTAEAVISTVPTPLVPPMIPSLSEDWKAR